MCIRKRIMMVALATMVSALLTSATLWAQPLGIMPQQPQKGPNRGYLCSDRGRFVFGQISNSSKDQFMLDTQTGRLWRISESGRIGLFLETVPYKSKDGTYTDLPASSLKTEAMEKDKK